jgi:hypothetical protein
MKHVLTSFHANSDCAVNTVTASTHTNVAIDREVVGVDSGRKTAVSSVLQAIRLFPQPTTTVVRHRHVYSPVGNTCVRGAVRTDFGRETECLLGVQVAEHRGTDSATSVSGVELGSVSYRHPNAATGIAVTWGRGRRG